MRHKSTELMGTIKAFVEEYYKKYRHSPSTTEIADAVGIARGTAYKYLVAMNENGMIRYDGQQISTEQTEKVQTEFTSVALLGAVSCGVPQNDVGLCDVFDGYPKAQAMEQALRCMSPQLIICDELGGYDDVQAVRGCVNSGVRLIATAHAKNMTELKRRPALRRLLNTGAFSDIVFLSGRSRAGEVSELVREVCPVAA